nr:hypothetical protein BaRGS_008350 [Batillaria attramentaria]
MQVRKAAQQAVKIVLKGSLFMTQPDAPSHHPAAALTAKFCVQIIESQGELFGLKVPVKLWTLFTYWVFFRMS